MTQKHARFFFFISLLLLLFSTISLSAQVALSKADQKKSDRILANMFRRVEPGYEGGYTPEAAREDLDSRINDLCRQIGGETNASSVTKIAVTEFVDLDGKTSDFGKFLSEEIITRLFQLKKFKVVERQLMNKVLREQKFEISGLVDDETAKKIGKILGVDAIIAGTITDMSMSVRINARMIGTNTGIIFGVASSTITKDDTIRNLMKVTSSPRAQATASKPQLTSEVRSNGFIFECKGLRRKSSGVVLCDVLVTNLNADARIAIGKTLFGRAETRIYTSGGRSYAPSDVFIGQPKSGDGGLLPAIRHLGIREVFMGGVPTMVTLRFDGATEDFDQFNVINLGVDGLSGKNEETNIKLTIPRL